MPESLFFAFAMFRPSLDAGLKSRAASAPRVRTEHESFPPDFDSLLDDYDRYRTGYGPALYDAVFAATPPRPRALDVGAGTGLAARELAPRCRAIVAIDVAPAMLRRCPVGATALARAEALPFRDGAFDLVSIAQAFHWMEPAPTYRELARVLAPGGVAAVWWKYEAIGDKTAEAADAAFERVVGKAAPVTPLETKPLPGLADSIFSGASPLVLRWNVSTTVERYVGYHASRENLRRAAGALRERVLAEMERDLRAMHPDGDFTMPYEQRLWLLRRP